MALTKISGSVIKDSVSLSGNVSVGGTLTYEDVTNVDALGIGTFRTGIKVLAGGINAVGVITATSFSGSGANLTGITGTTINNNANNRLITGSGTANTLEGESNLTFDGSTFAITGGVTATALSTFSASGSALRLNDGSILRLGNADADFFLYHDGSSTDYISAGAGKQLRLTTDDFVIKGANNTENLITAAKDGAVGLYHNNGIRLQTTSTGINVSQAGSSSVSNFAHGGGSGGIRIAGPAASSGANLIFANNFDNSVSDEWAIQLDGSTDDLVFKSEGAGGTARVRFLDNGGICFGTDTATANALDDYEEGNYDVSITGSSGGSIGMQGNINNLRYTRIGRMVHVTGRIYLNSSSNPSGTARMSLPFTSSANTNDQNGQGYSYVTRYNVYNPNSDYNLIFEIEPNQSYGFFLWDRPGASWAGVDAGAELNQTACYLGFDFTYTTAT